MLLTESLVTFRGNDVQHRCQCPLNDEPPNAIQPRKEFPLDGFYCIKCVDFWMPGLEAGGRCPLLQGKVIGDLFPIDWNSKPWMKVKSCSVMSDSLRSHELYSYTVHGILSLPQGILPTQGSNPGLPNCMRILYQLSHQRITREDVNRRTIKRGGWDPPRLHISFLEVRRPPWPNIYRKKSLGSQRGVISRVFPSHMPFQ